MAPKTRNIGLRPAKSIQDIEDRRGSLPTGVEGANAPDGFEIPASTIEDVDRAVFDLFEKRLKLHVTVKDASIPVSTIFAGGERVFLVKGNHPPKDRSGTFILPIVTIRRSSIEQSKPGVISGRGMGQSSGDLVIRKRLSSRDAQYQNLLNKLNLKNQSNVASDMNLAGDSDPAGSRVGTVATRRARPSSFNTVTGELLEPDLGNNIYEIITMPFPQFYTAMYEITFWTQYIQHMNSLIERFMTSYDAQGNQFRIESDKGYWYVAYVDDELTSDDNFSDYTEDERFVKCKLTMRVPAYLHGGERYGVEKPFRSFLSAPQITFEIIGGQAPSPRPVTAPVGSGNVDKFVLSDVQELDRRGNPVEQTRPTVDRVAVSVRDPFAPGGQRTRYLKVLSRNNRKGESVIAGRLHTIIDEVGP